MTNVTLERTAPTQNAPATYMPQAQGQAADRRIKEKAPVDAPAKMGVRNLDLYYKDFHALKGIDLQFPKNLVEGCRIEGEITLDGEDAYRSIDVNNLRRRVGMVFQQPNPFPMSVYDNVAFGPRTHGIKKREDLDAIVEQSLRDAAIWQALRVSDKTAFFLLGEMVEAGSTDDIFTNPADPRTADYVAGRFG